MGTHFRAVPDRHQALAVLCVQPLQSESNDFPLLAVALALGQPLGLGLAAPVALLMALVWRLADALLHLPALALVAAALPAILVVG